MGKSSAPTPPDPRETSAAQTGTNVATAIANTSMGQVDQYTPYGSLTYDQIGTTDFKDPYTGKTYQIPKYSSTTSLSDAEQGILDSNTSARGNLAETADERSAFLKDYLANTDAFTDQIDNKLYDLGRQRIDPRMEQARNATQTRLAQQGITPGSEAYNREMELVGQNENDAYNQLLLSGRGQATNEVNMPINQITALLSGSQVNNPNVSMAQPAQMPTTDNAGLINSNYAQQMAGWQQNQQNKQGLLGGLFGLGAAGITGGMFG